MQGNLITGIGYLREGMGLITRPGIRPFVIIPLIINAVLSVSKMGGGRDQIPRKTLVAGITLGLMATATQAISIVMIKPILNNAPLIWATEVRLMGGLAVLFLALLLHPSRRAIIASIHSPQRWGYTLTGSFAGGYMAMVFWLAGMKFTQASVAAVLNQTSNIFVFVFAALLLKEKVTPVRLIAIILGVGGVLLVTLT